MVWHGHILSSDIGLVFGLVFGLVLIGHWAGFVTQTWQPCFPKIMTFTPFRSGEKKRKKTMS